MDKEQQIYRFSDEEHPRGRGSKWSAEYGERLIVIPHRHDSNRHPKDRPMWLQSLSAH